MAATPKRSIPLRNFLRRHIPYWTTIGMKVLESAPGASIVRVPYRPELLNSNGVVHGGVVFSAADAAVAVALLGLLKTGERIATIEMKINFVKAVRAKDVIAEARILHRGSRTAVGEATVHDGTGNLTARALATYAIAKPNATSGRPPRRKRRDPAER